MREPAAMGWRQVPHHLGWRRANGSNCCSWLQAQRAHTARCLPVGGRSRDVWSEPVKCRLAAGMGGARREKQIEQGRAGFSAYTSALPPSQRWCAPPRRRGGRHRVQSYIHHALTLPSWQPSQPVHPQASKVEWIEVNATATSRAACRLRTGGCSQWLLPPGAPLFPPAQGPLYSPFLQRFHLPNEL